MSSGHPLSRKSDTPRQTNPMTCRLDRDVRVEVSVLLWPQASDLTIRALIETLDATLHDKEGNTLLGVRSIDFAVRDEDDPDA